MTKPTKMQEKILKEFLKDKTSVENSDENLAKYDFFDDYMEGYTANEKEAYVPKGMRVIGGAAFANSDLLEKVVIPESVKEIKEEAFFGCKNLKSVYINGKNVVIDESIFDNFTGLTIYCPAGSSAEKYAKDNKIDYKNI